MPLIAGFGMLIHTKSRRTKIHTGGTIIYTSKQTIYTRYNHTQAWLLPFYAGFKALFKFIILNKFVTFSSLK